MKSFLKPSSHKSTFIQNSNIIKYYENNKNCLKHNIVDRMLTFVIIYHLISYIGQNQLKKNIENIHIKEY